MSRSAVNSKLPILKATGTGGTALSAFHNALVGVNLAALQPHTVVECHSSGHGDRPHRHGASTYRFLGGPTLLRLRRAADHHARWLGLGRNRLGAALRRRRVDRRTRRRQRGIRHRLNPHHAVRHGAGLRGGLHSPHFVVNGAHCTSKPVCSLVIAPFEMSSWHVGAPVPADLDVSRGSGPREASAHGRALSPSRT